MGVVPLNPGCRIDLFIMHEYKIIYINVILPSSEMLQLFVWISFAPLTLFELHLDKHGYLINFSLSQWLVSISVCLNTFLGQGPESPTISQEHFHNLYNVTRILEMLGYSLNLNKVKTNDFQITQANILFTIEHKEFTLLQNLSPQPSTNGSISSGFEGPPSEKRNVLWLVSCPSALWLANSLNCVSVLPRPLPKQHVRQYWYINSELENIEQDYRA